MDGQGYVFACESGKVERDEVVGMLACQADIEGGAGLSVPDHDGYPAFGRIVLYGKEEEPFLYVQCDDVLFACQMSDHERRVGMAEYGRQEQQHSGNYGFCLYCTIHCVFMYGDSFSGHGGFLQIFEYDFFHYLVAVQVRMHSVAGICGRKPAVFILEGGMVVYVRDFLRFGIGLYHSVQFFDP